MLLCIKYVSRKINYQVFDLNKLVLWRETRFNTLANGKKINVTIRDNKTMKTQNI